MTFTVAIPTLPEASVAKIVMVVEPISEQSTVEGVIVIVGEVVQLSVALATTIA